MQHQRIITIDALRGFGLVGKISPALNWGSPSCSLTFNRLLADGG